MPDSDTDTAPATRQTAPGRARGRVLAVLMALVAVVLAVFGVRAATQDRIEAEIQGYDLARDGVLPVRIEIYRPADTDLTCSVIARDLRQVIVGQADVDIPAGPDRHLLVPVEVPLEGDGVAAEIGGCEFVE